MTNFDLLCSRLENERQCLIEHFRTHVYQAVEKREGGPFGKKEEEATEATELKKKLFSEKQMRARLDEIERALRKFEEGTYGLCDSCGKPIDSARLEILPQASLCVNCKTQLTRSAKSRSSPVVGLRESPAWELDELRDSAWHREELERKRTE